MRHRRPLCLLHRVSAHVWQRVALAAAASAAFWRAGVVRLGRRGSARICARGHLHVPRRAMDHLPTASAELPKRPNHQEGWWPEQGARHSVDALSVAHGQRLSANAGYAPVAARACTSFVVARGSAPPRCGVCPHAGAAARPKLGREWYGFAPPAAACHCPPADAAVTLVERTVLCLSRLHHAERVHHLAAAEESRQHRDGKCRPARASLPRARELLACVEGEHSVCR